MDFGEFAFCSLRVIGAHMPGEGFIASQKKLPRHIFRTLVYWRTRRPEHPAAIGTTQQARLFAPNELTHGERIRRQRSRKNSGAGQFGDAGGQQALGHVDLRGVVFQAAPHSSALRPIAPLVSSVLSVLPFR